MEQLCADVSANSYQSVMLFGTQAVREYLTTRRYSSELLEDYVRGVRHFCRWLGAEGISLDSVEQTITERFLNTHLLDCRCPMPKGTHRFCRPALGHFLQVLRERGIIPRSIAPSQPEDGLLRDFQEHLRGAHGATASTAVLYARHVRGFLVDIFRGQEAALHKITPAGIQTYVSGKAAIQKAGSAKLLCTALRAFFKFLMTTGRIEHPLDHVVPTIPYWRLSSVPKYIEEEQLKSFLSSFDAHTPLGLRDRAMALLMATAGLRSHEVANLTVDDVDWREGTIRLINTKSRRTQQMPLAKDAGEALAAYLQGGRPFTISRQLFVTHYSPVGRVLSTEAIRRAIRSAFKRCGLNYGTHVLRHTLATRLLRKGASLKEIADILRHQNIETTMVYSKVDLNGLMRATLPWPEVTA